MRASCTSVTRSMVSQQPPGQVPLHAGALTRAASVQQHSHTWSRLVVGQATGLVPVEAAAPAAARGRLAREGVRAERGPLAHACGAGRQARVARVSAGRWQCGLGNNGRQGTAARA